MDDAIPKLSDEAVALFFANGGFASPVVDLRKMLALECEHGPAIRLAAERWNVPPESVVV